MKKQPAIFLILIISMLMLGQSNALFAQKKERKIKFLTDQFFVNSDCGMCKTKIEHACDMKGVKSALYDLDTYTLTVVYKPSIISLDAIHSAISKTGYDTDKMKASDEAYNNLPGCCQYDRTRTSKNP